MLLDVVNKKVIIQSSMPQVIEKLKKNSITINIIQVSGQQ